MQGWPRKRENHEKKKKKKSQPVALPGTIPTCENTGVTRSGIELNCGEAKTSASLYPRPTTPDLPTHHLHPPCLSEFAEKCSVHTPQPFFNDCVFGNMSPPPRPPKQSLFPKLQDTHPGIDPTLQESISWELAVPLPSPTERYLGYVRLEKCKGGANMLEYRYLHGAASEHQLEESEMTPSAGAGVGVVILQINEAVAFGEVLQDKLALAVCCTLLLASSHFRHWNAALQLTPQELCSGSLACSLVSGQHALSVPGLHGGYWLLLHAPRMYSSEQALAYLATLHHKPLKCRMVGLPWAEGVEPCSLHLESSAALDGEQCPLCGASEDEVVEEVPRNTTWLQPECRLSPGSLTEVNIDQPECKGGVKREIPERIRPTSGVVLHDSHENKSGSDTAGYRTRFALECAVLRSYDLVSTYAALAASTLDSGAALCRLHSLLPFINLYVLTYLISTRMQSLSYQDVDFSADATAVYLRRAAVSFCHGRNHHLRHSSEDDLLKGLSLKCEGLPLQLLTEEINSENGGSFESFKNKVLTSLFPSRVRRGHERDLVLRLQKPAEPLYALSVDLAEDELVGIILDNVSPHVRALCALLPAPTTRSKLKDVRSREINIELPCPCFLRLQPRSSGPCDAQGNSRRCSNCSVRGHLHSECKLAARSLEEHKCFRCLQPGHLRSNCPHSGNCD
ncbi:hypothetical protein PR048_015295 [Dryococelus australis]|uniref:CCHC-type domain-containing protein n=1 Tax=Dryococelus australis TaxID=614101 RepID=A0ABQ9HGI8_9NEOP|nr:hypothetical protein PR048_015295 [Dryococelus australis]